MLNATLATPAQLDAAYYAGLRAAKARHDAAVEAAVAVFDAADAVASGDRTLSDFINESNRDAAIERALSGYLIEVNAAYDACFPAADQ